MVSHLSTDRDFGRPSRVFSSCEDELLAVEARWKSQQSRVMVEEEISFSAKQFAGVETQYGMGINKTRPQSPARGLFSVSKEGTVATADGMTTCSSSSFSPVRSASEGEVSSSVMRPKIVDPSGATSLGSRDGVNPDEGTHIDEVGGV